ncbi:MAG TPA: site-specific integrase [Bryobacteraceae bacterium]|nr:site-specific integrase [Bryobacteraceae bacterium]
MNVTEATRAGASPPKARDKDGLHKRRGIWHYKLKIAGKWKEVSTKKTNYREAGKVRQDAIQAQLEGRLPTDFAKLAFEKAAEQWLAGREQRVAPKTRRTDKERLVALKAAFGGLRTCDITSEMIRAFQLKRAAKVSARTVNLETKVLRMVLRMARLWARIADDFKSLPEAKRGPGRALSPEQEQNLFKMACSKPGWTVAYFAALLAANTTARGCELKGLRTGDVDLLDKTLTIRRTSTKTDAGARVVPLNINAMLACTRLLDRARKLGCVEPQHYLLPAALFRHTKKGDELTGSSGFDPTRPMQSWRTAWRALTIEAALPGLRFHDLRHHAITKFAEAGVPDHTLMAIAGHVSREMLEHYSHIRMAAKREAVAALDAKSTVRQTAQQAEPQQSTLAS